MEAESRTVELLVDETRKNNVIFKFRGENLKLEGERYESMGPFTEYSKDNDFDYGFRSVSKLDRFINFNNTIDTSTERVKILEDSIDYFFVICDHNGRVIESSTALTGDFKEHYWNIDCPDLYIHYVKKGEVVELIDSAYNMRHRMRLLETYWNKAYVTGVFEEHKPSIISDLKDLVSGYECTTLYEEIHSYIESESKSEEDIEEFKSKVRDYENRVQHIIDTNRERILESVSEYRNKSADEVLEMVGLDAGWVHVYPSRDDLRKAKRILSNQGETKWLDINLPMKTQSTTVKKKQIKELNRILEEEGISELLYEVSLD